MLFRSSKALVNFQSSKKINAENFHLCSCCSYKEMGCGDPISIVLEVLLPSTTCLEFLCIKK